MANSQLQKAKNSIRKAIKKRIQSEYDQKRLHYESEWVANKIRKSAKYQSAESVALFVSMQNGEIKTDSLIKHCFEDKKKVYLPRIIGDDNDQMIMLQTFDIFEISDEQRFTKSKWGIFEPNVFINSDKNEKGESAMD